MGASPVLASRAEDALFLNKPVSDFRIYVGFGNEVRIISDGRLETPPKTYEPKPRGKVPVAPTVVMGPNRIGFVGEGVVFYGGRSYGRWRNAAYGHTWRVLHNGVDVTSDTAHVLSTILDEDLVQTYLVEPQMAYFIPLFAQPGIYVVELTVQYDFESYHGTHTGTRQVIVYQDRDTAAAGVVEIGNLSGGISQGGWGCSLRIRGDLSFILSARDVVGYIPVVLMVETYYPNAGEMQQIDIGPNFHTGAIELDDPRIIFNGYIDRASIEEDVDHAEVRFECRTADMLLGDLNTHVVGFFESSNDGKGITFNDLMVADVYRYMLQVKSNYADFHDIRLYHNWGLLPWASHTVNYQGTTAGGGSYTIDNDLVPNNEYKDWTFNNGQYWSNLHDGADNQFEFCYVTREGTLMTVPDRNMWPPQVFYDTNSVNNWTGSAYDGAHYTLSDPDQPFSIVPIGPEDTPIATICAVKNPYALLFSTGNVWDVDAWTGAPVHVPLRITAQERLGAVTSYYKIVGSLSFWAEEWGADYPQNATDPALGLWLNSGPWTLVQGKYWSDQDRDKAWRNIWRFAARGYQSARSRYTVEVAYGMHFYFRECDMVELVYADKAGRMIFAPPDNPLQRTNWFEVQGISYNINLDAQTWQTNYQLREVTVYTAPDVTIPATPERVDD